MSRWVLLAALGALLLVPPAAALDVLSSESILGGTEARLLVRSAAGAVRVETEPVIEVAGSAPGGGPGGFTASPVVLGASHAWHGLDGIVVLVLRREDPGVPVDVLLEEGATQSAGPWGSGGVWVEWSAVGGGRLVPFPPALLGLAVAIGGLLRRRGVA